MLKLYVVLAAAGPGRGLALELYTTPLCEQLHRVEEYVC